MLLIKILKKKTEKKPTFIQKVDKWQTEMYLAKLEKERQVHN